jgi:CheY-like chemotaxis protein
MKKQILVVEDNPLNMELVTDLLEVAGFVVRQACNADDALRLARQATPDLILMDLSLPGLDGLAITRTLRSEPATRCLPIIALTAHAMRGDEELALQAGCDAYMSKPIDTRVFARRVATFITAANLRPTETPPPCSYAN